MPSIEQEKTLQAEIKLDDQETAPSTTDVENAIESNTSTELLAKGPRIYDNIYSNLVNFLETSTTVLSPDNGMLVSAISNNTKSAPQDEVVVHSLPSVPHEDINPSQVVSETPTRRKKWIWDEFNGTSNQLSTPLSKSITATAVKEKEHHFQSLVSKIKSMRETLYEKKQEVLELEMTLNQNKATHATRMSNQEMNWKDNFNK